LGTPQWRGVDFEKRSVSIGGVERELIYVLFGAAEIEAAR
jgi:hypothetical protein